MFTIGLYSISASFQHVLLDAEQKKSYSNIKKDHCTKSLNVWHNSYNFLILFKDINNKIDIYIYKTLNWDIDK